MKTTLNTPIHTCTIVCTATTFALGENYATFFWHLWFLFLEGKYTSSLELEGISHWCTLLFTMGPSLFFQMIFYEVRLSKSLPCCGPNACSFNTGSRPRNTGSSVLGEPEHLLKIGFFDNFFQPKTFLGKIRIFRKGEKIEAV